MVGGWGGVRVDPLIGDANQQLRETASMVAGVVDCHQRSRGVVENP